MPRRSSKKTSARKRQVDWVVNDETYGLNISLPNASQTAVALTLPGYIANYMDETLGLPIPRYQYPEQDQGQIAYAVKGHIRISPSAWAAGTVFQMMGRIVVKPAEFVYPTQAIVDPQYGLFEPQYANERFLWQELWFERFELGAAPEVKRVTWSGQVRIREDEALWLFLENQSGITQTLSVIPFLRTLMRANG